MYRSPLHSTGRRTHRGEVPTMRICCILFAITFIFAMAINPVTAVPLLYETWNSGSIDTNKWFWRTDPSEAEGEDGVGTIELRDIGGEAGADPGGDFALGMTSVGGWSNTNYFSQQSFMRGNNLRATFTFWGCPECPARDGYAFPTGSTLFGPWHNIAGQDPDDMVFGKHHVGRIEAVLGDWGSTWTADDTSNGINVSDGGYQSGQRTDADPLQSSESPGPYVNTNKADATKVRFWLGNVSGLFAEYSRDDPDLAAAGTVGTSPEVWIGFGAGWSYVLIDDIVVEDDDNILGEAPPNSVEYWTVY